MVGLGQQRTPMDTKNYEINLDMKVLIIFGTRPEAIKMAPLVNIFKNSQNIETKLCVTGQYRKMLDQVLNFFDIKPDFDLNIMSRNQNLLDITSKILIGLKTILEDYSPDIIFVHGDTTTTMAASIAAFYNKIKIAHIEAGLRTGNLKSPWPEEGNRKLTGALTNYHFAPTEHARKNLLNEGVSEQNIIVTGNTVIDALLLANKKIFNNEDQLRILDEKFNYIYKTKKLVLITGHRRESFGDGFEQICIAIKKLAEKHSDVLFLYPVHLNPNVQEPVQRILSNIPNVRLEEPQPYESFVYLMNKSYLILTDSGGIQEEAPSLGKPVLVLRENTERPEAIAAGTVKLVGTNADKIYENVNELLMSNSKYKKMANATNPYGDGQACERIFNYLLTTSKLN